MGFRNEFGMTGSRKNSFKRKKDALLLPERQKECVLFCLYNSVSVKKSEKLNLSATDERVVKPALTPPPISSYYIAKIN